jgi:type IV pili sensor histidine kinase/response regulator
MKAMILSITFVLTLVTGASSLRAQLLSGDASGQTRVGRYTTQAATPPASAARPLAVVAHIHFPRSTVTTVGEAMAHTLLRTGYRMVDDAALDPHAREFLALNLPESQRVMGPYPVSTILTTLLGEAWDLKSDPLTRQVWFIVNAEHQSRVPLRPLASSAKPASQRSVEPPVPAI